MIQKASSTVVWSWSPVYCPVRPSCSSPSSRRAQHQVTRGGTARGKEGEDSNLKSAASWRGRISNGCFRRADERADDRTGEDRYVLGAGPLDLWDSWSNELGEIKTRIENRVHLFIPAFSACVVFVKWTIIS